MARARSPLGQRASSGLGTRGGAAIRGAKS
jgi:hypothetical protein